MYTPGVAYSVTVRAEYQNLPGMLGRITSAIGLAGGDVTAVDVVSTAKGIMTRDFTVNTSGSEHGDRIIEQIRSVSGVTVHSISDPTFLTHIGGKIGMHTTQPVLTRDDMSKVYTPGVGRVCMSIYERPEEVWKLTIKSHSVAVVSDGTAVLGLGDIGPAAAMPVMEGKALLFKEFGGVDAWPIVLDTRDPDEIVMIVKAMAPGFGGINLEDISAPRCFYIEEKLTECLDIPVFHDDQHGTAVVVLAGLINAIKVTGKSPESMRTVVVGVGASGTACTKMLIKYGVKDIVGFDRQGALTHDRDYSSNENKRKFSEITNPRNFGGSLAEALENADFLLGLAGPGLVTKEMVSRMAPDAIVFALSNPDPEILPEDIPDNVRIVATGRTDYPNQVNNSLCFPGLFRGVLDVRAHEINDDMKVAAAQAIAQVIPDDHLSEDFIIPSVFDQKVARSVSEAVAKAAYATGSARRSREDDAFATRRIR